MEFFSLHFLLIFSILLYFYFFFIHSKSSKNTQNGFRRYPLVGSLPDFLRNRHRFLDWSTGVLAGCHSNTATFHRPGNVHGIITASPQIVEHMLKTNFENYPKGTRFRNLLEDFLGRGIFNTDGELWKIQRKTASYEFNTKSLRNFALENVTMELQTRLIPILEKALKNERILDFQDILERFAFDNICKVAFNVDPGCLGGDATSGGEFMQAFEDAATLSSGRFMYAFPGLYKIKKFFNLGSEKTLQNSIVTVHEFADKIIRSRMEERAKKNDEDLLSRFMGNSEYSAEFLRDIVISFILAGRDTTSSALSWFFWLLSSRTDVEEKILEELENIRRKSEKVIGDTYNFDELREMNYLQAAISEAMRLYPPVPVDTKACKEDDILPDGTFIGKNWFISYQTYAMGRMENIWGKDCCEYKPERWLENGVCKQENPFKFPVFHAGPRQCLGKDMAYIQMKSIAASILERFGIYVLLEKGKCPEHLLSLTLRMKGGLPVKVKERTV
ncbi:Cytochrome [Abeliophyllum distichum]|uniref:Cytochrome n=1 Tax=Abeliophyllum distichum TaxID=126358 RepID=A0ABD1QX57_9LAMI